MAAKKQQVSNEEALKDEIIGVRCTSRQKTAIEDDLGRLGLRKSHLELALMNPTTSANFVELRRVTSELADVDQALAAAEEAWLLLEERAP